MDVGNSSRVTWCVLVCALGMAFSSSSFSAESPGISRSIELVSRIEGEPPVVLGSGGTKPSISADGRFVAFESSSPNLVAGDNNRTTDIFVYDRDSDTTERLTAGANDRSLFASISADGRFVAFLSAADNLVASDNDGQADIFLTDRDTNVTVLLTPGPANLSLVRVHSISASGRFVVFHAPDLSVYDRETGETELVLNGFRGAAAPTISSDGRFVAFRSFDNDLVPGDNNGVADVFVYDRDADIIKRVTTGGPGDASNPSISADGRFVVFDSAANNLVDGDTNNGRDIFVYDREADTTELLTEGANSNVTMPSISSDGRFVTFQSFASNLVPGDINGATDIFVHDRETASTELITRGSNGFDNSSVISGDGQIVAFDTQSTNLVEGTGRQVVVYNRSESNFERVAADAVLFEVAGGNRSSGGSTQGLGRNLSISENGQFVAYASLAGNLIIRDSTDTQTQDDIFVFDLNTRRNEAITEGTNGRSVNPSISEDGRFVAFMSSSSDLVDGDVNNREDIFVYDREIATTERITSGDRSSRNPSISANGRFVAFRSRSGALNQRPFVNFDDIFVYDRETGTTETLTAGNDHSDNASISANGRYVAFRSEATNLGAGDTNSRFNIFVFDRETDVLQAVLVDGNGVSGAPSISGDGRFVAFGSAASNLIPEEFSSVIQNIHVFDRTTNTTEVLTAGANASSFIASISPDGRYVTFTSEADNLTVEGNDSEFLLEHTYVFDRDTNTIELITQGANGSSRESALSRGGRVVAFSSSATNLANDGTSITDVFVAVANDLPTANSITTSTNEDTPVVISVSGSDPELEALSFDVVAQPANGVLTGVSPDFIYTPNVDFFGTDSFIFIANDGSGTSEPATVSISVLSVNDPPVGIGVSIGGRAGVTTLRAPADTPFTLTLVGADIDSDQLSFSIEALPANGSLAGTAPNVVYTPDSDYVGPDSFTFTVNDGEGNSESVTISITVDEATISLLSAVLPSSRSVEVGSTATAFATLINTGSGDALACGLRLPGTIAGEFFYQATDPGTNAAIGERNLLVDIPAGGSQSFVFGITPTEEMSATQIDLAFQCANATDAASLVGLNTLLLSASPSPVPDLIALAATVTNNGVMELGNSNGFFTAATVNVGSGATISVNADTGGANLPLTLSLCQTDPATSVCINPTVAGPEPVIVNIAEGDSPTFAVFADASEAIVLDPANSRVFLRFSDEFGAVRGATSVAVQYAADQQN